jgi:hypothetical protein
MAQMVEHLLVLPTCSVWALGLCLTVSKNENHGQQEWAKQKSLLRERKSKEQSSHNWERSQDRLPLASLCLVAYIAEGKGTQTKPLIPIGRQPFRLPFWANQASAWFVCVSCLSRSLITHQTMERVPVTRKWAMCHVVTVPVTFPWKPWESPYLLLSHREWEHESWFITRGHTLTAYVCS